MLTISQADFLQCIQNAFDSLGLPTSDSQRQESWLEYGGLSTDPAHTDRHSAINRARKIFAPCTSNISIALEVYQAILAETPREVFVSTRTHGARPVQISDFARDVLPPCPLCGGPVDIIPIGVRCKKANPNGWNSLYLCQADNCLWEQYSQNTVVEELNRLIREAAANDRS